MVLTVMRLYVYFHFHAMYQLCMSAGVTEVAEMVLVLHCESHKHGLIEITYRDAGLHLRITPGNTIDGGECVDI